MLQALSLYQNQTELRKRVLQSTEPGRRAGPCLSIYLPKQSLQLSLAQRKFRFIKLVRQAQRLVAQDHGGAFAREFVAELWRSNPLELIEQSGLALAYFHDAEFTGAMRLPVDVPERMIVAESFHVKPVLSWLQSAPHFYLISLSARRVKIYEGTPWELKPLETFVAEDLQAAANGETSSKGARPRREDSKEAVRRFFLRAEKVIHPIISQNRSPVVIAGVSWLHPIYRRVNRDPDLLAHGIHGNVERWSEEDLREAVFEALSKLVERTKKQVLREFQELAYLGRASDDLAQVARAAVRGSVKKILVASDQLLFGKLDRKTGRLTLHPEQIDSVDDDVLDDLAETVLARGGKVLCVPSADLPSLSPVAAVFSGTTTAIA